MRGCFWLLPIILLVLSFQPSYAGLANDATASRGTEVAQNCATCNGTGKVIVECAQCGGRFAESFAKFVKLRRMLEMSGQSAFLQGSYAQYLKSLPEEFRLTMHLDDFEAFAAVRRYLASRGMGDGQDITCESCGGPGEVYTACNTCGGSGRGL